MHHSTFPILPIAIVILTGCTDADSNWPVNDGYYARQADSNVTLATVENGTPSIVVGSIEGAITGAVRFRVEDCPPFLYVPNGAGRGVGMIEQTQPGPRGAECPITDRMINAKWVSMLTK